MTKYQSLKRLSGMSHDQVGFWLAKAVVSPGAMTSVNFAIAGLKKSSSGQPSSKPSLLLHSPRLSHALLRKCCQRQVGPTLSTRPLRP